MINTKADLIKMLSNFPDNMPIRLCGNSRVRDDEFYSISYVTESHLKEQNTDGDPNEFWYNQNDLEPDERLKDGDEHFKYQGKLILIN
jgi:hypothetical protein